jgi:hypothetical protein
MDKPCKLCNKKRYANTSWCWKHFREREKLKKEEKARLKKERKESTKCFEKSLKKKLHNQMWKLMSEWIRRKDANPNGFVECYTCDKVIHYKEANCGHFKHDRLDGDERNLKVQCITCNKYYSGRLDVYAERLIRDYGLEWFNKLVRDAWAHKGYSCEDYARIIKDLKEKLNKLEYERH